ncbi:hypothetical protein ZHAS_00013076 [Anopheles sinensis]|uniref:Uncharacterized protein n=1 Tax=Anopheles sinensis TaxID=74873 RepID=A0A084W4U5_ANOSI|nr:hypothetical protein ZHAS_00013076 [Anopheles sinensis]
MKPSPSKKSSSSKGKQRTKSSSSGSTNANQQQQQQSSSSASNVSQSTANSNQSSSQQAASTKHSIPQSDSSGNDASNVGATKEKSSFKVYAGLSSRSVRTAWEQHDKQETEVAAEVYEKLAEDTTYKLWELANNIKTYARHSSGRVSYDLVNEVLKDADVPPVVGANSQPWDKIEYDGAYFFNSDEVLDLREEYIKHISLEQPNMPVLSTTWMAEANIAEDLIALHNNICDAVFIGDEACFNAAIDILQYNQHTPSLMKLLLTKAIEMLGFEYTEDTLRRSLEYLEALVQSYHVAHSELTLELSLLSQLFVNLLLGPAGYVHSKVLQSNEQQLGEATLSGADVQHQQQGLDTISPLFNNPMGLLENNLPPVEDSNNSNSNATEELLRSIENIKDGADGIDINIKDEYEALFSMVQGLGKQEGVDETMAEAEPLTGGSMVEGGSFQVKTEFDPEAYEVNAANFIMQQTAQGVGAAEQGASASLSDGGILTNDMLNCLAAGASATMDTGPDVGMFADVKPNVHKIKIDSSTPPTLIDADPEENVSLPMSESSDGGGEVNNPNSTTLESENITTLICEDYLVDDVCRVIGLCASKWGFVEQECTFLLAERLQRYFQERKVATVDFNWLSRIFRGLWSIGEIAFRELLAYFYQIDSQTIPEYLVSHFNVAIFLSGREDIFFYEYLYDVCGDSLAPFLYSYDRKYSIRILLSTLFSLLKTPAPALSEAFEDYQNNRLAAVPHPNQPPKSRFGFRFAGCRPVPLKTVKQRVSKGASSSSGSSSLQQNAAPVDSGVKQNAAMLKIFNSKIVVARRRLLSSVTNEPPKRNVFCYGSCTL